MSSFVLSLVLFAFCATSLADHVTPPGAGARAASADADDIDAWIDALEVADREFVLLDVAHPGNRIKRKVGTRSSFYWDIKIGNRDGRIEKKDLTWIMNDADASDDEYAPRFRGEKMRKSAKALLSPGLWKRLAGTGEHFSFEDVARVRKELGERRPTDAKRAPSTEIPEEDPLPLKWDDRQLSASPALNYDLVKQLSTAEQLGFARWWGRLTDAERLQVNKRVLLPAVRMPALQLSLVRRMAGAEIEYAKEKYQPFIEAKLSDEWAKDKRIGPGYARLSPGEQMVFRKVFAELPANERRLILGVIGENQDKIDRDDKVDWSAYEKGRGLGMSEADYKKKTLTDLKAEASAAALREVILGTQGSPLAPPRGVASTLHPLMEGRRKHQMRLLDGMARLIAGDASLLTFAATAKDWDREMEREVEALRGVSKTLYVRERELMEEHDKELQRKRRLAKMKADAEKRTLLERVGTVLGETGTQLAESAKALGLLLTKPEVSSQIIDCLSDPDCRGKMGTQFWESLDELNADPDKLMGTILASALPELISGGGTTFARASRLKRLAKLKGAAPIDYARVLKTLAQEAKTLEEAESAVMALRKIVAAKEYEMGALRTGAAKTHKQLLEVLKDAEKEVARHAVPPPVAPASKLTEAQRLKLDAYRARRQALLEAKPLPEAWGSIEPRDNAKLGVSSEPKIAGSQMTEWDPVAKTGRRRPPKAGETSAQGIYNYIMAEGESDLWLVSQAHNHSSPVPMGTKARAAGEVVIARDGRVFVNLNSGHFMAKNQLSLAEQKVFEAMMTKKFTDLGYDRSKIKVLFSIERINQHY